MSEFLDDPSRCSDLIQLILETECSSREGKKQLFCFTAKAIRGSAFLSVPFERKEQYDKNTSEWKKMKRDM